MAVGPIAAVVVVGILITVIPRSQDWCPFLLPAMLHWYISVVLPLGAYGRRLGFGSLGLVVWVKVERHRHPPAEHLDLWFCLSLWELPPPPPPPPPPPSPNSQPLPPLSPPLDLHIHHPPAHQISKSPPPSQPLMVAAGAALSPFVHVAIPQVKCQHHYHHHYHHHHHHQSRSFHPLPCPLPLVTVGDISESFHRPHFHPKSDQNPLLRQPNLLLQVVPKTDQ